MEKSKETTKEKDKPKEKEKIEDDTDVFDTSIPLDIENDICVFCKEGHLFGLLLSRICYNESQVFDDVTPLRTVEDNILDANYVWASRYSLTSRTSGNYIPEICKSGTIKLKRNNSEKIKSNGRRCFAHFFCALYAPNAWFDGQSWHNLWKEVQRSQLICKFCHKRGATIMCSNDKKCQYMSHIPCALKLGYRSSRFENRFYCPEHITQYDLQANIKDVPYINDISNGKETLPVAIANDFLEMFFTDGLIRCLPCDVLNANIVIDMSNEKEKYDEETTGSSLESFHPAKYNQSINKIKGMLLSFEYSVRNYDCDDTASSAKDVNKLCACDCEGQCDDVSKCVCQTDGKNYTFQGDLMPGSIKPIFECNNSCGCSIRRCSNRVAERGIIHHFEVFHEAIVSSIQSAYTDPFQRFDLKKVGIRAVDTISMNSFICQVTGQYVCGGSILWRPSVCSTLEETESSPTTITDIVLIVWWDIFLKSLCPSVSTDPTIRTDAQAIYPVAIWTNPEYFHNPLQWLHKEVMGDFHTIKANGTFEHDNLFIDDIVERPWCDLDSDGFDLSPNDAFGPLMKKRKSYEMENSLEEAENGDFVASGGLSMSTARSLLNERTSISSSSHIPCSDGLGDINRGIQFRQQLKSKQTNAKIENMKEFLHTKAEQIKDFLDKQLFLDCRDYCNFSRLFRQRPHYHERMVIHKLIYVNRNDITYPKFALYAAKLIQAKEEILF